MQVDMTLYLTDLNILRFWYPQVFGTQSPAPRGECIKNICTYTYMCIYTYNICSVLDLWIRFSAITYIHIANEKIKLRGGQ